MSEHTSSARFVGLTDGLAEDHGATSRSSWATIPRLLQVTAVSTLVAASYWCGRMQHKLGGEALEVETPDSSGFLSLFAQPLPELPVNSRPVVGILSSPCTALEYKWNICRPQDVGYIPSSYVKWLEAAGTRVVPLHHLAPREELLEKLGQVNGVMFPGGGGEEPTWREAANSVFAEVLRINREPGGFLPFWGTCLGFELVVEQMAGRKGDMVPVAMVNVSLPVKFTAAAHRSFLFNEKWGLAGGHKYLQWFQDEPLAYNYHDESLNVKDVQKSPGLRDNIVVLGTVQPEGGEETVALLQVKDLPVYATAFHPEKPQFEWRSDLQINHSEHSVLANGHLAHSFVHLVRRNPNHFKADLDAESTLMESSDSVFQAWIPEAKRQGYFVEIYLLQ
eukprot:CAMPEP_0170590096 /NCGR_PEP_ID=MMETSP0224-20130122/11688_1 /TAXON_ID=285029 /ORGANISM="Togula jolla, Strain CCCM 725" /LENGTH=391 /DNA_ID=CAMNT_0010913871 /DNA_START=67 /DNA_END=1242 /DNA_ORIENTATION=-